MICISLAACGNQDTAGQEENTAAESQTESTDSASQTEADASAADTAQEADTVQDAGGDDTAQNQGTETDNTADAAQGQEQGTSGSNILIAYFSVPETDGVDTVAGASRVAADGEVMGNNEYIARIIQSETGGDLFAIETVQEYPGTHDALLEFAYNEMMENARPELSSQIENLDAYDTIFLGYPNWNADLPMPLYTFLEKYDFSGKTIIPFTTHGGSGFSGTIGTIQELQPDASVVEDGLSISRNSVTDAESEVTEWVAGLGITT